MHSHLVKAIKWRVYLVMHLLKAEPFFGKVSVFKKVFLAGLPAGPNKIFDFVVDKKIAGIMDGTLKVAISPYCTVFENDLKSLIS